ncbi:MAG: hypothetical protein Q7J84_10505 [Sulfuricaulis sp.]|nr:hypothetical protein [Sulfuricaulis sp.]
MTGFSPIADPLTARQSDRIDAIPALYRTTHERLACELSLKMEDPEVVFSRYGYTPDQAVSLIEQPAFAVMLERIAKEVQASGLSFKTKAKAIAEDLLPHAYEMATDPQCSSAVRADIIKWAAKISGYEPSGKDEVKGIGGGFNLSITFAGEAPQQVVTHQPLTIEQEA